MVQANLLVVTGEPLDDKYRTAIVRKLSTALTSWDEEVAGNINDALDAFIATSPVGITGEKGEVLVSYDSGRSLSVTLLVNPSVVSFDKSLISFLQSDIPYKFFVYAGLTFHGSGSWIFRDSTKSCQSVVALIQSHSRGAGQSVFNVPVDSVWSRLEGCVINPPSRLVAQSGIDKFVDYVSRMVVVVPLKDLLLPSQVVGNIRFSRPTVYIFPSGSGDSMLFGITGFNFIVDGGYERKPCFWDFVRHLDRIDALLLSRVSETNVFGIKSFLQRKALAEGGPLAPEIGPVLFNVPSVETTAANGQGEGQSDDITDHLMVSVRAQTNDICEAMRKLHKTPLACVAKNGATGFQLMNLYHKIGQGSLDLYIINPLHDSKELKDYLDHWTHSTSASSGDTSAAVILVWRPASVSEKLTRLLYPGALSQHKLFQVLEKLKDNPIFQNSDGSAGQAVKNKMAAPKAATSSRGPASKSSVGSGSEKDFSLASRRLASKPQSAPAHTDRLKTAAGAGSMKVESEPHKEADKKHTTNKTHPPIPQKEMDNKSAPKKVDVSTLQREAEKKPTIKKVDNSATHKEAEKKLATKKVDVSISQKEVEKKPPTKKVDVSSTQKETEKKSAPKKADVSTSQKEAAPKKADVSTSQKEAAPKNVKDVAKRVTSAPKAKEISKPSPRTADRNGKGDAKTTTGGKQLPKQTKANTTITKEGDKPKITAKTTQDQKLDTTTKEPTSIACEPGAGDGEPGARDVEPGARDVEPGAEDGETGAGDGEPVAGDGEPGTGDGEPGAGDGEPGAEHEPVSDSHVDSECGTTESQGTNLDTVYGDLGTNVDEDSVMESQIPHDDKEPEGLPSPRDPECTSPDPQGCMRSTDPDLSDDPITDSLSVSRDSLTQARDDSYTGSRDPQNFDPIRDWGEPLGLPVPVEDKNKAAGDGASAKRASTAPVAKKTLNTSKLSEGSRPLSPKAGRRPPPTSTVSSKATARPPPFFIDLTYIPHSDGESSVTHDFFVAVRAKYYVLSHRCGSTQVLDHLVQGKRAWAEDSHDSPRQVTIVPTYESEALRLWIVAHKDDLLSLNIDIAPAAERCLIHLQDHEASCSAYRLEF